MTYPAQQHARKTFEKLFSLINESPPKHQIIFLSGEVTPHRHDTDREEPFRQESNFFYLSGCQIPGSHLVLTSTPELDVCSHLFIPPCVPDDLMWSPPPPDISLAADSHDVLAVSHTLSLPSTLASLLAAHPSSSIHILSHSSPSLFPNLHPALMEANVKGRTTDAYLLPALHEARICKTPEEVALIRHACAISSRAHELVMRVLGLGVKAAQDEHRVHKGDDRKLKLPGEWLVEKEAEAEALFVASCRREGAKMQAYMPIVAGSVRSSTLHYCCNDRELAWGPVRRDAHLNGGLLFPAPSNGNLHQHANDQHVTRELEPQVLLIDAGCEWNCYASDITRTMPVGNGGKFTPEAADIYDLVLEMQTTAMALIRPSIHWDAVHRHCHVVLARGFIRLGIFKPPSAPDPEMALIRAGVTVPFFPHGLGHSLGLDMHDVPSASKPTESLGKGHPELGIYKYLRLRRPLKAGMVVTVEPGIYFHSHLLANVCDSPYIDQAVLARYERGPASYGGVGGVRIEDVVLITENGYENLTLVRSDRAWLEDVCSGKL